MFAVRHLCLALTLLAVPLPVLAQAPEELLAAASALYDVKRYKDAAPKLEAFLANYPTHEKVGPAALALGRCRSELKEFKKAVPAYEKAIASKNPAVLVMAQLGLGESAVYGEMFEKAPPALEAALKAPLKPEQAALALYWLGQAYFELKRYPSAEEAYERVLKEHSAVEFADGAAFGSGMAALRQDKAEIARQRLMGFVEKYPKSDDHDRGVLVLAEIDLDAKRYKEARAGFARLVDEKTTDPEIAKSAEDGLATVLLNQGDYQAAVPRLEALLAKRPVGDVQHQRIALSLGHARYHLKNYDLAFTAYADASAATDEGIASESLYWAGNAAMGANKPAEGAAQFAKLVSRFPKNTLASKAQLKSGDALSSAKQTDAALVAYKAVLDNYAGTPQAAEARSSMLDLVDAIADGAKLAAAISQLPAADRGPSTLRLARIYLDDKKYVEVVSTLTEFMKSNPQPELAGEGQLRIGQAQDSLQKAPAAIAAYSEAVKISPNAPWVVDAQGRLAWLYLDAKQPAESERSALAALALKPDPQGEQQARLALVQAQLDQEKWDPALETSRLLLSLKPSPETTMSLVYTQAWVNEKKGKAEDAVPFWERIVAEFPKSEYAAEALVRVGDARLKASKFEDARDRYAALLTGFPRSTFASEARFKLGSALYNLNKTEGAAAAFDAVAADKGAGAFVPEALYWAGVALDKSDKKKEAIVRLTRLVDEFPNHAHVANAKIRLAALKAVVGQ